MCVWGRVSDGRTRERVRAGVYSPYMWNGTDLATHAVDAVVVVRIAVWTTGAEFYPTRQAASCRRKIEQLSPIRHIAWKQLEGCRNGVRLQRRQAAHDQKQWQKAVALHTGWRFKGTQTKFSEMPQTQEIQKSGKSRLVVSGSDAQALKKFCAIKHT